MIFVMPRPDPSVPTGHDLWRYARPGTPLTPREEQMLRLRGKGFSNREIGLLLGCREQSVKNALQIAYVRLEVNGPIQAFRKRGWLKVPE